MRASFFPFKLKIGFVLHPPASERKRANSGNILVALRSANPSGWFGKDPLQRPSLLTWLWRLMGQNWISGKCEGGKFHWELNLILSCRLFYHYSLSTCNPPTPPSLCFSPILQLCLGGISPIRYDCLQTKCPSDLKYP